MSYDIWMRCYPQADVNMSEEWELPDIHSLKLANQFVDSLEAEYAKEEWRGHRLYRAKFYPMERR